MKKTLILILCFIKCIVFGTAARQLPTLEPQGQGRWRTTEGVAHLTLDDAIFMAQNQSIAVLVVSVPQGEPYVKDLLSNNSSNGNPIILKVNLRKNIE